MREWEDVSSPLGKRIWYEDGEIEDYMAAELGKGSEDLLTEGRGIDVERLLMRNYGVEPDYCTLDEGVLGATLFGEGKVDVRISGALAEEGERTTVGRRRLRMTIAHEAAHVVLHKCLFRGEGVMPLLRGAKTGPGGIFCRSVGMVRSGQGRKYGGEWWEYQANRGMVGLLLPRSLVGIKLRKSLEERKLDSFESAVREGRDGEVVRELASAFDASLEATSYRLGEVGAVPDRSQIALDLGE